MKALGPQEMRRILAVTDALAIHRESVSVPLVPRDDGAVRVTAAGKLEIVAPADGDFDAWIEHLPGLVAALDLTAVRRAS
jgi:hypothetical protein